MRIVSWAAVAVVTAAVGVGLAASPASASPNGTCNSGRVCLYENNEYNTGNTDHWADFAVDVFDLRIIEWQDSDDSMDNETSSIKNRIGCVAYLYQHVGGTGATNSFGAGANDPYLANNEIGDNRASALDISCR